jgi:hypothetical protein
MNDFATFITNAQVSTALVTIALLLAFIALKLSTGKKKIF